MEKQHYIYRMVNDTTGEFYIGQRTCKGTAWLDGKYKGSGVLITKKVKAHPAQWKKEILCFAASHEMLNELEILYIGDAWRDDPKCLNLTPGGDGTVKWTDEQRAAQAERTKAQFASQEAREQASMRAKSQFASETARKDMSIKKKNYYASNPCALVDMSERAKAQFACPEVRAAASMRAKQQFSCNKAREEMAAIKRQHIKVRLTSQEGEQVEIARELLLDYLRAGYIFTPEEVCIHNSALRQWSKYSGHKAVALLLSDCGWVYGANTSYTKVSVKQVEESLK